MLLYHAGNTIVREPAILPSNRLLDFGCGFYTTSDRNQAVCFARNVVTRRGGTPMLNIYRFDEKSEMGALSVLRFDEPSEAWLDFVAANRSGRYDGPLHDLVIGPVANDRVYATIGLYMQGLLEKRAAIEGLLAYRLHDQFVFRTAKALGTLCFLEAEVLR